MKKYISLLAVSVLVLLMAACSKDTEGTTWVTYYPQMTLEGKTQMSWKAGVPFVDPGIEVIMNGEDVTDQVVVNTTMNLSSPQPGMYSINYSFVTVDGITAVASREVLVYGPENPLAGYYQVVASGSYYYTDANDPQSFVAPRPVSFVGAGAGTYICSDLMAGSMKTWYDWDNMCPGTIVVNADNTLTLTKAVDNGWHVDPFIRTWQNATYDPDTKTFSWLCKPYWSASPFIQVELKLMED